MGDGFVVRAPPCDTALLDVNLDSSLKGRRRRRRLGYEIPLYSVALGSASSGFPALHDVSGATCVRPGDLPCVDTLTGPLPVSVPLVEGGSGALFPFFLFGLLQTGVE